jgi:predicted protein tyrosine phosphatase
MTGEKKMKVVGIRIDVFLASPNPVVRVLAAWEDLSALDAGTKTQAEQDAKAEHLRTQKELVAFMQDHHLSLRKGETVDERVIKGDLPDLNRFIRTFLQNYSLSHGFYLIEGED